MRLDSFLLPRPDDQEEDDEGVDDVDQDEPLQEQFYIALFKE